MRSMWKGSLGFGIVNVPVKLYAATESHDVSFRQVHGEDGGRIKYRRVCSADGQEVAFSEISKGYEMPDGEIVVLTEEDFETLPLPTVKTVEITEFVPGSAINPIMHDKSYYVEPEPPGKRAYALITSDLLKKQLVAVCRIALRQRESLALLRPTAEGLLVLELLLWPNEVRNPEFTFLTEDAKLTEQEQVLAGTLVDTLTSATFDPARYTDGYTEALAALVAAKTAGTPLPKPAARTQPEPENLAAALAASVQAAAASKEPPRKKRKPPARKGA